MTRLWAMGLVLATLLPAATGRAAERLSADLSHHVVAITTGFTGSNLVLFGTRQEPGDVVVVVRGPPIAAVVRRAHHVLGFWINTESAVFENVPAFYVTVSDRPLDQIASESVLRLHQIGIANLHPTRSYPASLAPVRAQAFRTALLRRQKADGRFVESVGTIRFLGQHLFRTTIAFPANVPIGRYSVEVFLFRHGTLVAGHTVPLTVTEAGIDSRISQFAEDNALSYGLIAVAASAMAGWLLSLPFRRV